MQRAAAVNEVDTGEPEACCVAPEVLAQLSNLHLDTKHYVWMVLEAYGSDLELMQLPVDTVGDFSEVLKEEISAAGVEALLSCSFRMIAKYEDSFLWSWTQFALLKGIAPGQPFLIEVGEPTYTQDYYGECDMELRSRVVKVLPWPQDRVAAAWVSHLTEYDRCMAATVAERAKVARERIEKVEFMGLKYSLYFAPDQSALDDMEMPGGIRTILYSRWNGEGQPLWDAPLHSCEDDNGKLEVAKQRLKDWVLSEHPHITAEIFDKLPIRNQL